jgi:hypothetical protein
MKKKHINIIRCSNKEVGRKRERETHRQAKDDHFLSLQAQARHAQNLSGQYKDAAPQRAAKEETGGLSGVRGRCP